MPSYTPSNAGAPVITEVAPDVYRISIYISRVDIQFNHFLIRDEEPLLYATGHRSLFPLMREAVATLIDPARLRWIGFSHFEADECGALNHWLAQAPSAQALCGVTGARVNINDFADRPPREMAHDEVISTGKYQFRYRATPHLPHGWDAGMLFEETQRTLLCSDLFFQYGDVEPVTSADIIGRNIASLFHRENSPLADSTPYTRRMEAQLHGLADLKPGTLAVAHGSSFVGDGERALRDLHTALRDAFDARE